MDKSKKTKEMNKSEENKSKVESKKTNDPEVISFDLQPLLTPISILLIGVMISTSILFSFRNIDNVGNSTNVVSVSSDDDKNGDDDQAIVDDNGDDTGPETTIAVSSIDNDAYLGDKSTAKIAIIEFSDYECPFCQRHHLSTQPELIEKYVDTGEAIYVFRDFPLSFHEPVATNAAMAAECVGELGGNEKYYEFADLYFEQTATNGQGLQGTTSADLAESIGINRSKFQACVDSGKYADEIKADLAAGQEAGVRGTPGFVIGILNDDGTVEGVSIPGAQPFSAFESIIEDQLNN